MNSSGSGMTFTDEDVKMGRRIIGLLSRVESFKLSAKEILEAAVAMQWQEQLVKEMNDNVMELIKITKHPQIEAQDDATATSI